MRPLPDCGVGVDAAVDADDAATATVVVVVIVAVDILMSGGEFEFFAQLSFYSFGSVELKAQLNVVVFAQGCAALCSHTHAQAEAQAQAHARKRIRTHMHTHRHAHS